MCLRDDEVTRCWGQGLRLCSWLQPVQKTADFSQAQFVGTLLSLRLVRQIHVLREFLGAFGRISHIFYVKLNSDPEVDLSCSLAFRGMEKCAEAVARGNLDTTLMSPLYLTVSCSLSGRCRRRVCGALDGSLL